MSEPLPQWVVPTPYGAGRVAHILHPDGHVEDTGHYGSLCKPYGWAGIGWTTSRTTSREPCKRCLERWTRSGGLIGPGPYGWRGGSE